MDLEELLENARRNEALLRRLQAFELQLLSAQNWFDFLTLLLEGLPAQFDLDAATLKVCDPDGELKAAMLEALDIEQGVLLNQLEFQSRVPIIEAMPIAPPPPWRSGLALPLLRNGVYLGQLRLYSATETRFQSGMATDFMQHLAAVIAACLIMVKQSEEQARLALTDPLTGAENRRGFERAYDREWSRGQRQYHIFSMILLDLDHFKSVNDVHGHATGDRALRSLCRSLKGVLRPTDHIGRLGGEEFAVLLPGCQPDQLEAVVSRIQETIRSMVVLNDNGKPIAMTASGSYVPVTPRPHQQLGLDQVLEHLDTFLYQAKRNGRDCFVCAEQ
ncbi:GGDEF domain-containing protein [Thalassolituus sp. LLYu03]|uniref:GGDEF domain-containing protein n=1 Tax=Thalassolituus sp. LLYu03 TaxID=3421656 RepID=UPI003D2BD8F9